MSVRAGTRFATCARCRHPGLVWYLPAKGKRAGQWTLYDPIPGTERPDPTSMHGCFMGVSPNMSASPRVTRAYKPSEYRRKVRRK
jgi:hypothetical protein